MGFCSWLVELTTYILPCSPYNADDEHAVSSGRLIHLDGGFERKIQTFWDESNQHVFSQYE